jgi:hypothetical protein
VLLKRTACAARRPVLLRQRRAFARKLLIGSLLITMGKQTTDEQRLFSGMISRHGS